MDAVSFLSAEGARYDSLLAGLDTVRALPDPVGKTQMATQMDEGLSLYRVPAWDFYSLGFSPVEKYVACAY